MVNIPINELLLKTAIDDIIQSNEIYYDLLNKAKKEADVCNVESFYKHARRAHALRGQILMKNEALSDMINDAVGDGSVPREDVENKYGQMLLEIVNSGIEADKLGLEVIDSIRQCDCIRVEKKERPMDIREEEYRSALELMEQVSKKLRKSI